MKKVLLFTVLALFLVASVFAGGEAEKTSTTAPKAAAPLQVWSFTDELEGMINNYYLKAFPDAKIEYSMTPTEQFPSKLDPVLASGQGTPDVFALEDAFVRKYVESGLLLDLSDIYEANKDKLLAYPTEVGSFNGKVYGMSWQATPGAMFYRRSLAKKYLGTDDPVEVQKYFTDLDTFLATAEILKTKSGGKCVVVSTTGDLLRPFLSGRDKPWVVDGKLYIDPTMEDYMDLAKTLSDKGYEGRASQWAESWFAGMSDALADENGNILEVFSYFLPTWGLHYTLKPNAGNTGGDWAMIEGPSAYRWGGTWIGAWAKTKQPEAAKQMITYLTTDDAFLKQYALDSGDVVSNLKVVNEIKDNYSEAFLGGQNHYAQFAEMAKNVDGSLTQGTDQAIEALFQEAVAQYVLNEKSKADALAGFRQQVADQLGL